MHERQPEIELFKKNKRIGIHLSFFIITNRLANGILIFYSYRGYKESIKRVQRGLKEVTLIEPSLNPL